MTTPKRNDIRLKATETFHETNTHLPTITPTDNELKENGLWNLTRNDLMRNNEKHEALGYLEQQALELGYRLTPTNEYEGIETETYHGLKFDISEAKRSNILVSGSNHSGKTLLSCSIASVLMRYDWRVIVFDSSGVWKNVSNIPLFYTVTPSEYFFQIPTTNESIVYDISALIPERQKTLVDFILRDLWNNRGTQHYIWNMVILEEAQLFMKNIRGTKSKPL